MITPLDIVLVAGFLGFVSWVGVLFIKEFFCTRPWPNSWKRFIMFSLIGIFARVAAARTWDLPIDLLGSCIYLFAAFIGVAFLVWEIRHSIGADGDRCKR